MELYAGIDIGGSHLAVGLINGANSYIIDTREMSHTQDVAPSDVIHSIVKFIDEMMDKINLDRSIPLLGIGVGCPGQTKDGILVKASNLPKFQNAPLEKMLSQAMRGVPVILLNDADAAISAEVVGNPTIYGQYKNIALVTLGTGIGVGLILEGQLYQGSNGLIEAGHMIVATHPNARKCGCGQVGCVEAYSSARNTSLRLEELDALDNPKQLASASSESEKVEKLSLNGKDVFSRYAANEYNAVTVVEEVRHSPLSYLLCILSQKMILFLLQTAEHLATLVINLCRVVDLEVIVFGGGLSKAGNTLLNVIKKHVHAKTWTVLPTDVLLRIATVHEPGLLGTALAAKQKYGKQQQPPPAQAAPQAKTSSSNSSKSSSNTKITMGELNQKLILPEQTLMHPMWIGAFLAISSLAQYYIANKINQDPSSKTWKFIQNAFLLGQIGVGFFVATGPRK